MSNVAKLKKKAAELELKRQFDKAIAVYVELLESFDQHADELDVALFNRVGDLLVRQGNIADAVDYYEKAVDHYTDGGFFNNAIALCNKILRHSPGRTSIHYKLGRISAKKGFKNDAKQNFLQYADRMQKAGNLDEAFRALKEFADLCPDQDDIRLMLADQLSKQDRKSEAIEQLQLLHERYVSEGRDAEAVAAARRMKALDPAAEPRAGTGQATQKSGDLVFLDLDAPTPRGTHPTPMQGIKAMPPGLPARRPTPMAQPKQPATSSTLPFIELDPEPPKLPDAPPADARPSDDELELERGVRPPAAEPSIELSTAPSDLEAAPPLEGLTRVDQFSPDFSDPHDSSLIGLERTQYEGEENERIDSDLLDLEPTVLSPLDEDIPPIARDETAEQHAREAPPVVPTVEHSATSGAREADALEFILPDEDPEPPRSPRTSQELLAELDPPLVREEAEAQAHAGVSPPAEPVPPPAPPRRGPYVAKKPAAKPPQPATKPKDKQPPTRKAPDEPLVPSLTLDDAFADRLSASKPSSDDEPSWNTGSPSTSGTTSVIDPDDETEGSTVAPRESTMIAAQSVEMLEAAVESEPSNWPLRRQLGEAMLESGDREGGVRELKTAMVGAERAGDLDSAGELAEEIARLEPGAIQNHQKRVEFAFRTNDKPRLIEAYLALAEALMRAEQTEKSKAVFQRVLDLAPDDIRAQAALETFAQAEAAEAARKAARRAQSATPTPMHGQPVVSNGRGTPSSDFVNLGDWLRDEQAPMDTRMVVPEHEPTGDEEADFQDMLRKFKQGIAENVDESDHQAHYDLGVAFKEMSLLDEAIAEFQKALRSPTNRVPTYEALGQCFMEKEQYAMAHTVLNRALHEKNMSDDQLVGVLYLLGRSAEALGKSEDALAFYQRVFVVDIEFRDVAERISEVERAFR